MSKRNRKSLGYVNTPEVNKSVRWKSAPVVVSIIIATIFVVGIFSALRSESNYYLKDAQVCKAKVEEKSIDNGKYYLRLSLIQNTSNTVISGENSWIEVNNEFYSTSAYNNEVGVLLGSYDVYRRNFIGSGQKFEKSTWGIDEIYASLDIANKENPQKTYISKATIAKKKITKSGDTYLVLTVEDRTMNVKVASDIYSKMDTGMEVDCEFEALGELIKIKQVIG